MKISVIGGTGLIGSKLVKRLRDNGQEVLAASPDSGVNISHASVASVGNPEVIHTDRVVRNTTIRRLNGIGSWAR